jgi:cellulose synthase operon protein C
MDRQDADVEYPSPASRPSSESRRYANNTAGATPSLGDLSAVEDPQDVVPPLVEPIKRTSLELPLRRAFVEPQDAETNEAAPPARRTTPKSDRESADSGSDSEPAEKLQDAVRGMETPSRSEGRLPSLDNRGFLDRNQRLSSQKDLGNNLDLPLSGGAGSNQVASAALPPLTGAVVAQTPMTPREQIEQQLAMLEGASSGWVGGTSALDYRSGQPGYDRLAMYSGQFEASGMLGPGVRTTFIVKPVLLDAGQPTGTETIQQGTLPLTITPSVQSAAGTAGEFQLQAANFGARIGTTPRGFLVQNYTGGLYIHPASAHFRFDFSRDPILDTQLSFAGLRDEGPG